MLRSPVLVAATLCIGLFAHAAAQTSQLSGPQPDLSAYQTKAQSDAVYATPAQAAAAAPVQSVNTLVGAVTVPVYQRQVSGAVAVATADGTVSWTFPTAFTNPPTCFYSLFASATTHTFDFPQVTAISRTAVSLLVSAHPKSLSIASLTLPIVLTLTPAGVPAGTTITFSCFAPA